MAVVYVNPIDIDKGAKISMSDGGKSVVKEVVKRKRYAAKGIHYNRLTLNDGTIITRRDHARLAVIDERG